jgi:hypothetical protein
LIERTISWCPVKTERTGGLGNAIARRLLAHFACIGRMLGIEWPAIVADFGTVSMHVDAVLHAHMAIVAQRLKRTESKRIPIAAMWRDVISDRRWGDDAALDAERTQRFEP